jgi:hypothetical protein
MRKMDEDENCLGLEPEGAKVVTTGDVIYRGRRDGDTTSNHVIEIYGPTGDLLGVVGHKVKHSPTGMAWGYGGSGPADAARSLLIAVLGDGAHCPECGGTGLVFLDVDGDGYRLLPPIVDTDSYPDRIIDCPTLGCEKGIRSLPYQRFKERVVAGLPGNWIMTRSDILAWLLSAQFPIAPPPRRGRFGGGDE